MNIEEAQAILKKMHDGIAAGRTPPEITENTTFPLHAQWNSFPIGGNEHYAITCVLGRGMTTEKRPVKRSRPFFDQLLRLNLIDIYGNASQDLEDEVNLVILVKNAQTQRALEVARHEE